MISVREALDALFGLVAPLPVEDVPLIEAAGRVLARDVTASRDQPPFPASAMDGYAVSDTDTRPGAVLTVIGESAAGRRYEGRVAPGRAVRIFTGAPVPEGADRVVLQEDVTRDGDSVTLGREIGEGRHIRPAGTDFLTGHRLAAPRRLTPHDVALLAAMNVASVPVARRPEVALISTGDELVLPGETPGPDQIVASNTYGLHASLGALGARCRLLPIARDDEASLITAFGLAEGADLVITIGGASVGDHDIVATVAETMGMERAFYKVAMRPGKPLMAGRLNGAAMIGLPGNPVSAMVCGHVFVAPVIRAFQHLPAAPAPRCGFALGEALPANGPREHYMRARAENGQIHALERQDSSLLTVLSEANSLLVRAPHDRSREVGETMQAILL